MTNLNGDGVLYTLVGDKHAAQLAVSILSLRDHWQGPVAIMVGDEKAHEFGVRCEKDTRLAPLQLVKWHAPTRGQTGQHGTQYLNKTRMFDLSPFSRTVFLDADTLVVGDFRALWPRPNTEEVRLTQFADFTTTTRPVRSRVEGWRQHAPREVARSLAYGYPGLNTGVMAFTRLSKRFMAAWREMTARNVCFICDEIAAQLVFLDFPHMVLDERWNASPVHGKHLPGDPEVRIWHFHGRKHVRRERCREIWLPAYDRAVAENVAGIAEWTPAGDRQLRRWLKDPSVYGCSKL
jgi:hypothetical protein